MSNLSSGMLEVRRNARVKELGKLGPVLCGSLATIKVTCGNANCKCARGEKHTSNILTKKVGGKSKAIYVPTEMLEDARIWTENFKKAKRLMKEISDYNEKILRKHVKVKRAKKRNLAVASRKSLKK